MDVIAAQLYDGYSYRDQTISELSAVGASTRAFWIPLGFVYSTLMIAFAFGVWASAGERRALRIVAILAGAIGVIGFVGWPFAPMHQREVLAAGGGDMRDTMHLALGGINSLIFMVSMAVGAVALGKRFRLFTLACLGVILVFGFLTWANAGGVDDNADDAMAGCLRACRRHRLDALVRGARCRIATRSHTAAGSSLGPRASFPA